ncbi:MAG: response regulator transcription factor [Saprospiraceae bacterium]|nr:response regulator transcription factor [Saprospiraceae bacterium]
MIKTIIIEDEIASQELLSNIITDYCPDLRLKGVASGIEDGIELIKANNPDLVFLDIQIGNDTGFDLLDLIDEIDFKVIITTAHEEYALKAFKYEAIDYILKPYTPKDVVKSVQRIRELLSENSAFQQLEKVIKNSLLHKETDKITIPTVDGLTVYKLENITRIEGNGAYCKLFSTDSKALLISKSLRQLEAMLPENQFYRIHDSHIINLLHVREFRKEDGGIIILENDEQVPVSRRKKQEFLERMMEFGRK